MCYNLVFFFVNFFLFILDISEIVWVYWKYFISIKAKCLSSELATDLAADLNTAFPGASPKDYNEFECLVTDREKRSQHTGSCTTMPMEQVTVKLKGFLTQWQLSKKVPWAEFKSGFSFSWHMLFLWISQPVKVK